MEHCALFLSHLESEDISQRPVYKAAIRSMLLKCYRISSHSSCQIELCYTEAPVQYSGPPFSVLIAGGSVVDVVPADVLDKARIDWPDKVRAETQDII